MITGSTAAQIFTRFTDPIKGSKVCQDARVSVQMPNGDLWDVKTISLAENRLVGARETHRLVIQVEPETAPPGDVMKKIGDIVMT